MRCLNAVSNAAAWVAIAMCAFGWFAWLTGRPALTTLGLDGPFLTFAGTIILSLTVLAVAATVMAPRGSRLRIVARIASLVALVVSLMIIIEYAADVNLGVDRFFAFARSRANPVPGRPAPETATAIFLLNLSYWLAPLRGKSRPAMWLKVFSELLAGALPLIALTGYVFAAPMMHSFFSISHAIGMSIMAALSLLSMSVSWLIFNSERGTLSLIASETAGGYMARRLVLTTLVAPPLIGVMIALAQRVVWFGATYRQALTALPLCVVFLVLTWVTARRLERAERMRIQSEERFKRIAERAADVIFSYCLVPTPRYDYISPAVEKIFGIRAERFYANPTLKKTMIYTEDALTFERSLEAPELFTEPFTLRWVRADGSLLWTEARYAPVYDEEGALIRIEGLLRDITDRVELERLREEWASVIAHDLRQPITAVELQSELLLAQSHDEPLVRKVAAHIQASAKQLNRMTSDLLDISRLESKRLALDLKPTKLDRCLRETIERVAASTDAKRIRLIADETLPEVPVDPGRIEQVLSNLLSNALKYSYPGTEIEIELKRAGDRAEISVTNAGKGIDGDGLKRIFQRFQRTEGAKKDRIRGIGLGLYIAKGLVEAHGGTVQAESELGKKTTFRVFLPISANARVAA